ncbi:FERM domain-containing protein 3 [Lucilia cuprina]|nr:FERM domain-containing protein 3 [Lucilia cuprina]
MRISEPFHRGSYLVDFICDQLKIKEKDYFGLRYVDVSKQRHWLDLGKSVIKQCKDVDPILFSFRVKFYPADPFRLTGNGRIMLYQQLKRDLRHGRLYCSIGEAAALGSLIVQEEIGDFNEDIHIDNYVSSMNLALRQTETLEKKIMELHKKRQPYQDPSVAIDEFMGIARGLETYGIDPHPVKDHRGSQLYIGINYSGISTFISGKRSQHFRWNEVHKINFEGKMFIAHLSYTDASREPKKVRVHRTLKTEQSSGSAELSNLPKFVFVVRVFKENIKQKSYSGKIQYSIATKRTRHITANNTSGTVEKAGCTMALLFSRD